MGELFGFLLFYSKYIETKNIGGGRPIILITIHPRYYIYIFLQILNILNASNI